MTADLRVVTIGILAIDEIHWVGKGIGQVQA